MRVRIGLATAALLWMQGFAIAGSWESTITASSSPSFPNPRPLRARYGFAWSGFPCAIVESKLTKPGGDRLQLNMTARTTGLARALLKYDATHISTVDASTLRPIAMRQVENDRGQRIVTELAFNSTGVVSKETESPENQTKTRRFDFPRLFDLQSAMLYIRSQPLQERSVQRIVVYPGTSPYLATVTVLGRERVTVPAGTYNAIKFDLQLNRIKDGQLLPHRKFRRATAWLSDDPDRLMLKIEAQVFIGTVFCQLQAVDFENPKS
ncbi:MAG TPA: DUF3108 domain-containing protein [Chthoniobacterales bacterium]|jgi:hypothetical protein|nr:DUF3108 domain-containing protein [Chthoniobacterales bacterium]